MFRGTLFAALALLFALGLAHGQSLNELAKKEKERRSKTEENVVREVDADGLSAYDDGTVPPAEDDETVPRSESTEGKPTTSWTEVENPNRRPRESTPPQTKQEQKTRQEPNRDPTLGPKYIEDHLYGEEKVRKLRREASDCRLKERASSARCKALDKKADDLEKLMKERRRLRSAIEPSIISGWTSFQPTSHATRAARSRGGSSADSRCCAPAASVRATATSIVWPTSEPSA
jgi:hypothetical protein